MTDCHTNTATARLSVCHEAPEKIVPIQADLSWSLFLSSHFALLLFVFSSSVIIILLPFCPFCLNGHLPLLGPATQRIAIAPGNFMVTSVLRIIRKHS